MQIQREIYKIFRTRDYSLEKINVYEVGIMTVPANRHISFELSWHTGSCTPIPRTGNNSSLFFCSSCWTNRKLPLHLLPSFFTVVGEAGCLWATAMALMALQVRLLTFPLSALLLLCGLAISSPIESRYKRSWMILLLLPIRVLQHPQYNCIYTDINQGEGQFQTPARCLSRTSVFPQKLVRGELSYLAPLGSENISAPYFKQCFFRGGVYPPDKHHASKSQDRHNKYFILHIEFCINNKI